MKQPVYSIYSLELAPPPTTVDGFPAAVTSDMGTANDLSDMGTGMGARNWNQAKLDAVARRAAAFVAPSRIR